MIPTSTIFALLGLMVGVSVLAFIFSWASAKGLRFQSCKGDGSCGCDGSKHGHHKTADKILALIGKEKE